VAYHTKSASELTQEYGAYGVRSAAYANRPVLVEDDLAKIVAAIRS